MTNMDLMALLSTIVLVATIATTVFAVAAYAVSRGYTRKKVSPKVSLIKPQAPGQTPILKRYDPAEVNA